MKKVVVSLCLVMLVSAGFAQENIDAFVHKLTFGAEYGIQ